MYTVTDDCGCNVSMGWGDVHALAVKGLCVVCKNVMVVVGMSLAKGLGVVRKNVSAYSMVVVEVDMSSEDISALAAKGLGVVRKKMFAS